MSWPGCLAQGVLGQRAVSLCVPSRRLIACYTCDAQRRCCAAECPAPPAHGLTSDKGSAEGLPFAMWAAAAFHSRMPVTKFLSASCVSVSSCKAGGRAGAGAGTVIRSCSGVTEAGTCTVVSDWRQWGWFCASLGGAPVESRAGGWRPLPTRNTPAALARRVAEQGWRSGCLADTMCMTTAGPACGTVVLAAGSASLLHGTCRSHKQEGARPRSIPTNPTGRTATPSPVAMLLLAALYI